MCDNILKIYKRTHDSQFFLPITNNLKFCESSRDTGYLLGPLQFSEGNLTAESLLDFKDEYRRVSSSASEVLGLQSA